MSIISIFSPLLWWILGLCIFLSLWGIFKPRIKGKIGEWIVKRNISDELGDGYQDIHDLTFYDEYGTTQIDHIIISPFGLFVIETKNYIGWIFANERQKVWIQQIYKNRYKFQNPLHQNYRHINVVTKLLKEMIGPEHIHSLVVFQNGCEFKTDIPAGVFIGKTWIKHVRTFNQVILSELMCKRIRLKLENSALERSFKTNQKHIKSLKNKYDHK